MNDELVKLSVECSDRLIGLANEDSVCISESVRTGLEYIIESLHSIAIEISSLACTLDETKKGMRELLAGDKDGIRNRTNEKVRGTIRNPEELEFIQKGLDFLDRFFEPSLSGQPNPIHESGIPNKKTQKKKRQVSKRARKTVPNERDQAMWQEYQRQKSYRKVGSVFGISATAARKHVISVDEYMKKQGHSVQAQRLPHDNRGQLVVQDRTVD